MFKKSLIALTPEEMDLLFDEIESGSRDWAACSALLCLQRPIVVIPQILLKEFPATSGDNRDS